MPRVENYLFCIYGNVNKIPYATCVWIQLVLVASVVPIIDWPGRSFALTIGFYNTFHFDSFCIFLFSLDFFYRFSDRNISFDLLFCIFLLHRKKISDLIEMDCYLFLNEFPSHQWMNCYQAIKSKWFQLLT